MPEYKNPGVYVSESAFLPKVRRGVTSRSAAAFFGEAPRGPSAATLVQSWSEYKTLYGDLSQTSDLGFAVYHYFANGGRDAWITRVIGSTAVTATATVAYYPNGSGQASASLFTASAKSKGGWGNNLTLEFSNGNTAASSTVMPTFNLVVKLSGIEVERWNDLSPDIASSRYFVTILNNYSSYITNVAAGSGIVANAYWIYNSVATTFASGSNGSAVQDTDYVTALGQLDSVEGVLLLNAVNKTSATVINQFLAKAESRGNSFVIIDPDMTAVDVSTIGGSVVGSYTSSNYGAVYYPHLTMVDPSKTGPGAVRATAPGGAIAGVYVRTEIERNVAKSPAGYNVTVRNSLGLGTSFTEAQTGTLYSTYNVNVLKTVPGGGIIINGARTLDKAAPGKFISARRTLNYLKQVLKEGTESAVFEPNDSRLWDQITGSVSALLGEFWRQGGLKGKNASEAYYVICDASNNTSVTVDNGEVHIEVGVALQYPAEFVVINLSQWTGGSNATETL